MSEPRVTTEVEWIVNDRYVKRGPDAPWRFTGYGPFSGEGDEQAARDLVARLNEIESTEPDDLRVEYRLMKKTTVVTFEEA